MKNLPKSKRGARRQVREIFNRAYRELAGGLSFGLDWPTFRSYFPTEAAHVDAMRAIYKSLPE